MVLLASKTVDSETNCLNIDGDHFVHSGMEGVGVGVDTLAIVPRTTLLGSWCLSNGVSFSDHHLFIITYFVWIIITFLSLWRQTKKLHMVQNVIARQPTGQACYCQVMPLLKLLHWVASRFPDTSQNAAITRKAHTSLWWDTSDTVYPQSTNVVKKHPERAFSGWLGWYGMS